MSKYGWNQEVDVVVVGSGAGGLSAAITAAKTGAEVLVLEKADLIGGTSAWSGGGVWAPCNDHLVNAGLEDSREAALAYIDSIAADRLPDRELVEIFVDTAADAVRFLEENSAYKPSISPLPDYFGGHPGFTASGRCLGPEIMDSKEVLGDWWDKVRDSPHLPPIDDEEWSEINMPVHARPAEDQAALVQMMDRRIKERRESGIRFMGPALVSGLLRGALDAGVTLKLNATADRLVFDGNRVRGLVVDNDGTEAKIGARRGVILATGGFEWNDELTKAYLGITDCFPMSPSTNVGDGLQMGLENGAAVTNMGAWLSMPGFWDRESTEGGRPLVKITATRQDSGTIIVNRQGRRFMNEAITYMDVGKALRRYDELTATYPNSTPLWMIFDQSSRERCVDIGSGPTPDWVPQAPTIAELAAKIDLDPTVLTDEVQRWNSFVDAGADPDFHRGEVWWESYPMGGTSPEQSMSRIERAPFYAMQFYNGVAATYGGLSVDANGRVKAARGGILDGLYAVGAVAGQLFGQAYPGPGATLGPNLVFGYLAGRHAADSAPQPA